MLEGRFVFLFRIEGRCDLLGKLKGMGGYSAQPVLNFRLVTTQEIFCQGTEPFVQGEAARL